MMSATQGRSRIWLKRGLALLVALVTTGFFVRRLVANASQLPRVVWNDTNYAVLAASVALALGAICIAGCVWQVLLRDQGVYRPLPRILSLYLVAQFGKYLPGNVGQFVGRVVMARAEEIPVPVTLMTMVIEVLWGIGSALGIAALGIVLSAGSSLMLPPWLGGAGLATCFLVLIAAPWVGMFLLQHFFPRALARATGHAPMRPPSWRAALWVTLLSLASYVGMGLLLRLQSHYWFSAAGAPLLELAGFFALAWLAGYILPGAPAGIGVRESVMLLLLAPSVGEATALALGVTMRLTTTLADALAFCIGTVWRYLMARKEIADDVE